MYEEEQNVQLPLHPAGGYMSDILLLTAFNNRKLVKPDNKDLKREYYHIYVAEVNIDY